MGLRRGNIVWFEGLALPLELAIKLGLRIRILQGHLVHAPVLWLRFWIHNRKAILYLTGINGFLTLANEAVVRTTIHYLSNSPDSFSFLVDMPTGGWAINRQSLTNIWMSVFASLLGGPVYFFNTRLSRFLFFMGFGVFNSALSQLVSGVLRDGMVHLSPHRLFFDLIYSATIRFGVFEFLRRKMVESTGSAIRMTSIRVSQDVLTTSLRVLMLNGFGFRG